MLSLSKLRLPKGSGVSIRNATSSSQRRAPNIASECQSTYTSSLVFARARVLLLDLHMHPLLSLRQLRPTSRTKAIRQRLCGQSKACLTLGRAERSGGRWTDLIGRRRSLRRQVVLRICVNQGKATDVSGQCGVTSKVYPHAKDSRNGVTDWLWRPVIGAVVLHELCKTAWHIVTADRTPGLGFLVHL